MTIRGIAVTCIFAMSSRIIAENHKCEEVAATKQSDAIYRECQPLAEKGKARAQFLLAESLPFQSKEAQYWARKSATQGYVPAQLLLANLLELSSDLKYRPEAVEWFKKAASSGNHAAEFRLGEYYSYPDSPYNPLNHSEELSLQWIQRSAEGGFYNAQKYLGLHYEDGVGLPIDKTKSKYWFQKALQTKFDPALALKLDKDAFAKPMRFAEFAPCGGSGCKEEILGIGVIQRDTYLALTAMQPRERQRVIFHSPGGDLMGGLRLGQEIRRLNLNTAIGGKYEANDSFGILVDSSICASSCAFAFLGGIERAVYDSHALLFHQFFTELRISPESKIQETVALLSNYVATMGISREMLDGVLMTRPEQLGFFNGKELWRYQIINSDPPEEVSQEAKALRNHWSLQFLGEEPYVTLQRPSDSNTGVVSLMLTKEAQNEINYKFVVAVNWPNQKDKHRLATAFKMLNDRSLNFMFCTQLGARGECKKSSVAISLPGSSWNQIESQWIMAFDLTAAQYSKIITDRPHSITMDCDFANAYGDYRFCGDPYLLTESFYKLAKLLL